MNYHELLNEREKQAIFEQSLRLLSEIGHKFKNERILNLLEEAGAEVDHKSQRAKIPEELVKRCLSTTPHTFKMYDRDGKTAYEWGAKPLQFGAGGSEIAIMDPDGTYRKPTTEDLLKMYRLTDQLPEVTWTAPGSFVCDVPDEIIAIWRFYIRLKYGMKPSCADGITTQDLRDNLKLMRVIRSDEKEFVEKPFAIIQPCPMSPLIWNDESCNYLLEAADNRVPALMIPMPFSGVSAPITLAGAISQIIAENLSGLVVLQLIAPHLPVVCCGSGTHADMRSMHIVIGSPDNYMMNAGATEILHWLGIPSGTGAIFGYSDSKMTDYQAGVESALGQLMMASSGLSVSYGIGVLAGMNANSLEKIVLDHEVYRYVKRYMQGIEVSEETLAFDTIQEVVEESSDFIGTDHTFDHFRDAYLMSDLFDTADRMSWQDKGSKPLLETAHEQVEKLLASGDYCWLDPETDAKLDACMDEILHERGLSLQQFAHLLPQRPAEQ